ncbi:MAG: hypothetical protein KAV87_24225 [Desulfobacteraceae bacterium]|nr:hypothetical protein [Desulfobacteraceae bacterium]
MEEFMNTTRDKLEVIKHETKELAGSLKKISDALAGIDSRSATICGATLENILDLIYEYEIRNGKHPMSSKSIKKAFRPDRIKIGNAKPLKDTCNEIAGLAFNLHTKLRCEEKKAPTVMYGSVDLCGNWFPNKKLTMLPSEQYAINVENDYLCGKCMMAISSCMCGGKT